jgi:phosphoribosylformylglycinamidine synthase
VHADDPAAAPPPEHLEESFLTVLGSPNLAAKRWAFEQYDSLVQGQTVAGPGGDAAIVRIEGTLRAVAISSDGNGRYGRLDPYLGAVHAVAVSARNVAAAGARPIAITNCLNFGNPERPEVMWQFAETIRGMADACRALDTPVTGGNVSFYNESGGSAIDPTPVIGMLGILDDYRLMVRTGLPAEGIAIYALGSTLPELGGSEYAEVVLGKDPAFRPRSTWRPRRGYTDCWPRRPAPTCWRRPTTARAAACRWPLPRPPSTEEWAST